jgi:dipeptidyl-peptidase-4
LKGNDVLKWHCSSSGYQLAFYDSVYTERYMQTPQENANGYDDTTNKPCEQIEREIS